MWYLDTSVIVSALVPESTTDAAVDWLAKQQLGSLSISQWVLVECSAALSRKVRTKRLSELDRDLANLELTGRLVPQFAIRSIQPGDYFAAQQISARHEAGLRSGDALHLAIATTNNLTLVTFDKPFAAGAVSLGYNVELIA